MSSSSSLPNGAYVRIATEPHEFTEAGWILARAFARDPCMNWFGSVKEMFPKWTDAADYYDKHFPTAKKTLKSLFVFQYALVKATIICGGFITMAVVPKRDESNSAGISGDSDGDGGKGKKDNEVIAGVTLWLKPNQPLDFPVSTLIRSGVWKVFNLWGFNGVKRVLFDFSPAVERSLKKGFEAHNLDRLDSWHLLEMVVDPPYEGKGLCSLMMRDGFQRTTPKPIHLEATTSRSRDIYFRFGFEVDEEHCFGKGVVDVNGLTVKKKEEATGYPEWIMTKYTY